LHQLLYMSFEMRRSVDFRLRKRILLQRIIQEKKSYFSAGIEFLGPIFVKFGQWISTRWDVFPRDICDTLSQLQRNATPHSWLYTERLLEATYGPSWQNLFVKFDGKEPIGSGCCAQVCNPRILYIIWRCHARLHASVKRRASAQKITADYCAEVWISRSPA